MAVAVTGGFYNDQGLLDQAILFTHNLSQNILIIPAARQ
jgi:hypothetical protein